MFTIIIQEKGGEQRRMVFNKPEVTIGRVQGNDIVLPKGNVSKRHARIVLKDGKFIIVDLKSTNGTYVNGRKITSPLVVKETDKIYIGDFIMGVDESGAGGVNLDSMPPDAPMPPAPAPMPPPSSPTPPPPSSASPELLRAALSRQAPPPGPPLAVSEPAPMRADEAPAVRTQPPRPGPLPPREPAPREPVGR